MSRIMIIKAPHHIADHTRLLSAAMKAANVPFHVLSTEANAKMSRRKQSTPRHVSESEGEGGWPVESSSKQVSGGDVTEHEFSARPNSRGLSLLDETSDASGSEDDPSIAPVQHMLSQLHHQQLLQLGILQDLQNQLNFLARRRAKRTSEELAEESESGSLDDETDDITVDDDDNNDEFFEPLPKIRRPEESENQNNQQRVDKGRNSPQTSDPLTHKEARPGGYYANGVQGPPPNPFLPAARSTCSLGSPYSGGSGGTEDLEAFMEYDDKDASAVDELVQRLQPTLSDPNQCAICRRILSCKSALQMHYRTHTGERPFKCRICLRAFTTKGNLKTHMCVHKLRSAAPAQCSVCFKTFGSTINLQQHLHTHMGQLPVQYVHPYSPADPAAARSTTSPPSRQSPDPTSPAKYSPGYTVPSSTLTGSLSALERSVREIDKRMNESSPSLRRASSPRSSNATSTSPVPGRRLPLLRHTCTVCEKPFSSASALQIHMRTHTGERPFKCNVCSKAFTTKGNLKVHMSTHALQMGPPRRGRRMSSPGLGALSFRPPPLLPVYPGLHFPLLMPHKGFPFPPGFGGLSDFIRKMAESNPRPASPDYENNNALVKGVNGELDLRVKSNAGSSR